MKLVNWSRSAVGVLVVLSACLIALGCGDDELPVTTGSPTTGNTTADASTGGTDPGTTTGGIQDATTGTTDPGTTGGTDDAGTTGSDPGGTGEDPGGTTGGEDVEDTCNCNDGNPCTKDKCDDAGNCTHEPSTGAECAPTIKLTYPGRATTWGYTPTIAVEGEVTSPLGEVSKLTVNGIDVQANGNSFGMTLPETQHGVNILSAQVTDAAGQATAVQSFLMGEGFYPVHESPSTDTLVTKGLVVYMGKSLWDDDDLTDVDDVATLAHLVLDNLDVGALIPQPLTSEGEEPGIGWCEWTVFVYDVTFDVYSVDVKPAPGGVFLSGTLTNLVIDFDAKAPDFLCPDAIGTATAATVTLGAFASIWLDANGKPQVVVADGDVDAVLGPLVFDITGGIVSGLDFILNWFDSQIAGWIELAVEDALVNSVSPMIGQLIDGVGTFVQGFEIPALLGITPAVQVEVAVEPSYIFLDNSGATIGLAISATTPGGISGVQAYGSLARNGCFDGDEPSLQIPKDSHVAVALHDDLLNQALFAAWWGGLLDVDIDVDKLADIQLDLPIDGLKVAVKNFLPPVMTSCTPNGKTQVQLGDVRIVASFDFNGAPASVEAFVSAAFEIELDVAAAPGSTVDITFGVSKPVALDFEIVSTTGSLDGAKNLLQIILTNVVEDVVLKSLSEGIFKSFPVPSFDLSTVIPGVPADTVLAFDPTDLKRLGGYVVLNGTVVD